METASKPGPAGTEPAGIAAGGETDGEDGPDRRSIICRNSGWAATDVEEHTEMTEKLESKLSSEAPKGWSPGGALGTASTQSTV